METAILRQLMHLTKWQVVQVALLLGILITLIAK